MTQAQWRSLNLIKTAYNNVKIRNTRELRDVNSGSIVSCSINTDLGADDFEIDLDGSIRVMFEVAA